MTDQPVTPSRDIREALREALIEAIRSRVTHGRDARRQPLDSESWEKRALWQAREDIDVLLALADEQRDTTYARHEFRQGGYLSEPLPDDCCVWRVDGHSPYCEITRAEHDDVLARRRAGLWHWPSLRTADEQRDTLDAALPTDEQVKAELHRVLCQNAHHRSRFTGECRAAPNIARGLRSALAARLKGEKP